MGYIYSLIQDACEVEMLRGECVSMMEGMAEEVYAMHSPNERQPVDTEAAARI